MGVISDAETLNQQYLYKEVYSGLMKAISANRGAKNPKDQEIAVKELADVQRKVTAQVAKNKISGELLANFGRVPDLKAFREFQ